MIQWAWNVLGEESKSNKSWERVVEEVGGKTAAPAPE